MLNETHSTLAPCYPFRYPLLLRWSQKEVIDLLIKGDNLMKISDLIRELLADRLASTLSALPRNASYRVLSVTAC